MTHEYFSGKAHILFQPRTIRKLLRVCSLNVGEFILNIGKNLRDSALTYCTITADIAVPRLHVKLDGGYTSTVLPSVMLLLHQQIKFIQPVKRGAILFLIKRQ